MSDPSIADSGRSIWQDRITQTSLGLAILLNLLLFALVLLSNDQLARASATSATPAGGDDHFGSPSSALILPIIGLVSWLLAGALGFFYSTRDQTTIAYTIWGAAVLIQLATWVPVLTLIIGN